MCHVLHSIGEDIEKESPGRMSDLLTEIRDLFLEGAMVVWVRDPLMWMVELKASGWTLPHDMSK